MRNHDIALAERWHEANEIQHAIVFGDTFQMSRSHGSVGMASLLWRWQSSGGSIPRWSVSKTQARRPAERQRARTKKKSGTFQMTMNWPADHRPCCFWVGFCFVWFVCVGFCFAFVFCFLFGLCWFLVLVRWQLMDLSILPSLLSVHIVYIIMLPLHYFAELKSATGFPACWTTWREPYALDGKKAFFWSAPFAFRRVITVGRKRLGLSTRGSKKDCFKRMVGHMRTQVDHCTEGWGQTETEFRKTCNPSAQTQRAKWGQGSSRFDLWPYEEWCSLCVKGGGHSILSFDFGYCSRMKDEEDKLLWRPFWAKPVLRRFPGPRIGSVGASCFVDDFVCGWGKWGAYRLLLEPTWS